MIRFSCPGCGATYSVEDAKGGKTGKCPKCQSQFVIPAPEGGTAPPPLPKSSPPSPAVDPNAPVEIAPCPKCDARLSVAASDLGVDVECPYCKTVYKAARPAGGAAAPKTRPGRTADDEDDRPSRRGRREEDDEEEARPSRRRRDEDEEEERPSRRSRRDDDEADEDRPSRRRRDEDVEDEERPRKKKRRRRGGGEPHRGTLILVLGILAFVGCGIFTAIPAWVMGRGDLAKMDDGIMDDEGRQTTQIGMYLGMASCILTLVVFAFYCVIGIIGVAAGGR